MAKIFEDRYYTEQHDWVLLEKDIATIGITEYAQDSLGDIVYIEISCELGKQAKSGEQAAIIESNKAASDILFPVSGKIIAINLEAINNPKIVNSDPYDEGWIIKVCINNAKELDSLMNAQKYEKFLGKLED